MLQPVKIHDFELLLVLQCKNSKIKNKTRYIKNKIIINYIVWLRVAHIPFKFLHYNIKNRANLKTQ